MPSQLLMKRDGKHSGVDFNLDIMMNVRRRNNLSICSAKVLIFYLHSFLIYNLEMNLNLDDKKNSVSDISLSSEHQYAIVIHT